MPNVAFQRKKPIKIVDFGLICSRGNNSKQTNIYQFNGHAINGAESLRQHSVNKCCIANDSHNQQFIWLNWSKYGPKAEG